MNIDKSKEIFIPKDKKNKKTKKNQPRPAPLVSVPTVK